MKKFLIAALLLLMMSGAAFAAEKPRVIVLDPNNLIAIDAENHKLRNIIEERLIHTDKFD